MWTIFDNSDVRNTTFHRVATQLTTLYEILIMSRISLFTQNWRAARRLRVGPIGGVGWALGEIELEWGTRRGG